MRVILCEKIVIFSMLYTSVLFNDGNNNDNDNNNRQIEI